MVDELSDFFFTSNSTEWQCPDFNGFACTPPAACAQNSTTSRTYCCDAGKLGDVCWTTAVTCATDGSTITCGGQDSYCCLAQGETCTKTFNQINICWSTSSDILANISDTQLNATFSSLSSASPSASSFTFNPPTSSSTSTPVSASSITSDVANTSPATITPSPTTVTPSSTPISQSSLSSAAIAGIVIGAIAGIFCLLGAAFLIGRSSKQSKWRVKIPQDEKNGTQMAPHPRIAELDTDAGRYELSNEPKPAPEHASKQVPQELPGEAPFHHSSQSS